MQLVSTKFDLDELEKIQHDGVEIESSDFGTCSCGQLKLIVGVGRAPYDYCIYSHGEVLFKVQKWEPELDRQQAVAKLLKEIGCDS